MYTSLVEDNVLTGFKYSDDMLWKISFNIDEATLFYANIERKHNVNVEKIDLPEPTINDLKSIVTLNKLEAVLSKYNIALTGFDYKVIETNTLFSNLILFGTGFKIIKTKAKRKRGRPKLVKEESNE